MPKKHEPPCSLEQAEKLRATILQYWEAQGYDRSHIRVETVMDGSDAVIRSGLINGSPPCKPVRYPQGDAL